MSLVRGSRAAGYGKPKKSAKFQCVSCRWVYEEPQAGGTECPRCGHKYVHWINPQEFIQLAEEQDKKLAVEAEKAKTDAINKVQAALNAAKKSKHKKKDAKKARKQNRKRK